MNTKELILDLGIKAKKASSLLAGISVMQKNSALKELIINIRNSSEELIEVNKKDVENALNKNFSSAIIDRLTLTPNRILEMIK